MHIKEFVIVVWLWGTGWAGQRIVIYFDNDSVCDTCVYQKPKNLALQQLLREFLFWVCKFNFFPVLEKIGTKENHIADFISRNHIPADIDNYFESCGLPIQFKVDIPPSWFDFQADW